MLSALVFPGLTTPPAALRPRSGYRWLALLLALLLHLAALCGLPAGSRPAVTQAPQPLQVSVSFSEAPAPQAPAPAAMPVPTPASPAPARRSAPATAAPQPATASTSQVATPADVATPAAPPASAPAAAGNPAPTAAVAATGKAEAGEPVARHEPPRYHADYLHNPQPPYPPLSRRLRESGSTLLRVHVTAEGVPDQVLIKQGSGYARLDQAAEAAVSQWRFVPARSNGQAVAGWVEVPILFKLDDPT